MSFGWTGARSILAVTALGLLSSVGLACSAPAEDAADGEQAEGELRAGAWEKSQAPNGVTSIKIVKDAFGNPILKNGQATIYAIVNQGYEVKPTSEEPSVFRSTDSGKTFEALPSSLFGAMQIAVAPSNPEVIYAGRALGCLAGGYEGFMRRSDDGGRTWKDVTGGYTSIDINPTDPMHLVGASCAGLGRSLDGGKTWQGIPGTEANGDGSSLTRGMNDRKTLYATAVSEGGYATLRRSTDDGLTWSPIEDRNDGDTRQMQGPRALQVDPLAAQHLYLVSSGGFYSSSNGGDRFNAHNDGLDGAKMSYGSYQLSNIAFDHVSQPQPGATATLYIAGGFQAPSSDILRWSTVREKWEKFAPAPTKNFGVTQLEFLDSRTAPYLIALSVNYEGNTERSAILRAPLRR